MQVQKALAGIVGKRHVLKAKLFGFVYCEHFVWYSFG
jgi:hypothetical protein